MPRYFYDLDPPCEPDMDGTVQADDRAAVREAVRYLGEVLKTEPVRLEGGEVAITVSNEDRRSRWIVSARIRGA